MSSAMRTTTMPKRGRMMREDEDRHQAAQRHSRTDHKQLVDHDREARIESGRFLEHGAEELAHQQRKNTTVVLPIR